MSVVGGMTVWECTKVFEYNWAQLNSVWTNTLCIGVITYSRTVFAPCHTFEVCTHTLVK